MFLLIEKSPFSLIIFRGASRQELICKALLSHFQYILGTSNGEDTDFLPPSCEYSCSKVSISDNKNKTKIQLSAHKMPIFLVFSICTNNSILIMRCKMSLCISL